MGFSSQVGELGYRASVHSFLLCLRERKKKASMIPSRGLRQEDALSPHIFSWWLLMSSLQQKSCFGDTHKHVGKSHIASYRFCRCKSLCQQAVGVGMLGKIFADMKYCPSEKTTDSTMHTCVGNICRQMLPHRQKWIKIKRILHFCQHDNVSLIHNAIADTHECRQKYGFRNAIADIHEYRQKYGLQKNSTKIL